MLSDTTLALYVIKLIEVLDDQGIEYRNFLISAGITAREISSRNERIALVKYVDFVEAVLAHHELPDLGLIVGHHTNILEHGVLGYSLLSSTTLEQSLQRYIRFQHLVGPVLQVGFYREGNLACLTAAPKRREWQLSKVALQYFYQEWLAGWVQWNELIGLHHNFLEKVELGVVVGKNAELYGNHLHCPVTINHTTTRAWFSAELLRRPLGFADKVTGEICSAQCELLLDTQQRKSSTMVEIHWRLANSPGVIPSMEMMADQLCVSARTLRRYLKNEKVTYRQVVLDFRMLMAKRYLSDSPFSANDIADLVGYSNPSNFYRIFRREVGMTPQHYRDTLINSESQQAA